MRKILMAVIFLALGFFTGISFAEETQQDKKEVIKPKKVSVDTNYDGKVDRTEVFDKSGNVQNAELDRNGDGKVDEWVTYQNDKPAKTARDTNADGLPDVWIEY